MNAEANASPTSKTFTSWKLNLLDAMLRDPKMKAVDFPVAYAIVQAVNQFTRVAHISDNRLQALVHRDRKAFLRARRRLVSLGWMEVRTGRYGRATEYQFRDERAMLLENIRLDEQILADEEQDSEPKTPHCRKPHSASKMPHCDEAGSGAKVPHRGQIPKAPHSVSQWGKNVRHSGAEMPPLHLQTPKRETLPSKYVTPEAYDAHVQTYDRWAEFEETAARLEYDDEMTRQEAEHQARLICGYDADAGGRQGAVIAPPTEATINPWEGLSNDQD